MSDVPQDAVARGVEDGVEGDGEFDDAQGCAEVTAGGADDVDGFGAQLVRQDTELIGREITHIGGNIDPVERGGAGPGGWLGGRFHRRHQT